MNQNLLASLEEYKPFGELTQNQQTGSFEVWVDPDILKDMSGIIKCLIASVNREVDGNSEIKNFVKIRQIILDKTSQVTIKPHSGSATITFNLASGNLPGL